MSSMIGDRTSKFLSEILLFYRKYDRIELIQPNNCISGSGKVWRLMQEITITFLTPQKEDFTGTAQEVAAELQVRTLKYGSCGYQLPANVAFLFDMEDFDE